MGRAPVSLRRAKIDDHWRHAFSRTYKTRFTEISFRNLSCLANNKITFSGGLNAIVGPNGVGMSTIASAIVQLLSADPNTVEEAFRSRLAGSSLDGIAHCNGAQLDLSVRDGDTARRVLNGAKFTGDFTWLDPSTVASRYVDQFHRDTNFKDLLEQVSPLKLNPDDLRTASYLVGKKYDDIAICEISDYAGLERFPYFSASSAGVSYNSEWMGRGELSLLLTYWTILDMPKDSILILEEPETHVSPGSQDSLMNVIAKFCDEKGIWVILITHSPAIVRRIPKEHIKLLVRDAGPVTPVLAATKLDIALLLGGGVAYSGIILVEDEGAKQFLLAILEKLDSELLRQFEIVPAGSASIITALLKGMPQTRSWLTLIGAYDGGMQGDVEGAEFKWPFTFLPGGTDPEELLTNMIETTPNINEMLASELHTNVEQVQVALNHVAGNDYHDYLGNLATSLNIDVMVVRREGTRIWLRRAENLSAAKACVEAIRNAAKT